MGGGASTLADDFLANGFATLLVLDLLSAALAAAQRRLGTRAALVQWIEAENLTECSGLLAYGAALGNTVQFRPHIAKLACPDSCSGILTHVQ